MSTQNICKSFWHVGSYICLGHENNQEKPERGGAPEAQGCQKAALVPVPTRQQGRASEQTSVQIQIQGL